jgi:hypothetical protein
MINPNLYRAGQPAVMVAYQTRLVFIPHVFSLLALLLVGQGRISPYAAMALVVAIGVLSDWYHLPTSRPGDSSEPRLGAALAILLAALILLLQFPGWRGMAIATGGALVIHVLTWSRRRYALTADRRLICEHGLLRRRAQVYWLPRTARYNGWDSGISALFDVGDLEVTAAGGSVILRHIGGFAAFYTTLIRLAR